MHVSNSHVTKSNPLAL